MLDIEDISHVQCMIEFCLLMYMSQKETVYTLKEHKNIHPTFTRIVWEKLEEKNKEFFKAYRVRLRVKKQIITFNFLLQQQADAMKRIGASSSTAVPGIEENSYNDSLTILSRHGNSRIIPTAGPFSQGMINNRPSNQDIQHTMSGGALNADYIMNNNNLGASFGSSQGVDLDYNLSVSGVMSSNANVMIGSVFENEGIFQSYNNENPYNSGGVSSGDVTYVNQNIQTGTAFRNLRGMDQGIDLHYNRSICGGVSSNANVNMGMTSFENVTSVNQGILQYNNALINDASFANQQGMDPGINLHYDHSVSGGGLVNADVNSGRTIFQSQSILDQNYNNNVMMNNQPVSVNPGITRYNDVLINGASFENQHGIDQLCNFGLSDGASNFNTDITINTEAFGSGNVFQQNNFNGGVLSGGGLDANGYDTVNQGNNIQLYNHQSINEAMVNSQNVNPINFGSSILSQQTAEEVEPQPSFSNPYDNNIGFFVNEPQLGSNELQFSDQLSEDSNMFNVMDLAQFDDMLFLP